METQTYGCGANRQPVIQKNTIMIHSCLRFASILQGESTNEKKPYALALTSESMAGTRSPERRMNYPIRREPVMPKNLADPLPEAEEK